MRIKHRLRRLKNKHPWAIWVSVRYNQVFTRDNEFVSIWLHPLEGRPIQIAHERTLRTALRSADKWEDTQ